VGQTGWSGGGGPPPAGVPGVVNDLSATGRSASSVTLTWTQVDDGTGAPAKYRVKYAQPSIDWRTATIGCASTISGTAIGAPLSCTVQGLSASTEYEFLLMSYRVENGAWVNARYSNVASATTTSGALTVNDLRIAGVSRTSITVRWTEIDDGTGNAASYRVKYKTGGAFRYVPATTACTIPGREIGGTLECTAEGLEPNLSYEFQLMSYRLDANGVWVDTHKSNITAATTASF